MNPASWMGAAAARALLPAALTVLAAGIVAASAAGVEGAVVASTTPAPGRTSTVTVTPALMTRPVPIDLASSATTTATVAPATTTSAPAPVSTIASPATTAEGPSTTAAAAAAPAPPASTAPAPAAPASPTRAAEPDVDLACERELFDRTNATRAANGLAPLAFDARPHAVARRWARTLAAGQRLEHNLRYGEELDAEGVPWRTIGENIGRGQAARMFELWMESSTHRANILEPSFTGFAVACISADGGVYVTQDFYG